MHPITLNSGWDTFVFGVPLIALLFFGYFKVDELFVKPKNKPARQKQPVPSVREATERMCSDPDGRPWDKHL